MNRIKVIIETSSLPNIEQAGFSSVAISPLPRDTYLLVPEFELSDDSWWLCD